MEDQEVPIPQPEKPTREQSIRAIFRTLRHNRDVQADIAWTVIGVGLGGIFSVLSGGNPKAIVAGAVLGHFVRPTFNMERTNIADKEAEETNAPSFTERDFRYGIEILNEAWKTGQVQPTLRTQIPTK